MRAIVARVVLVFPMEADLPAFEKEMREVSKRHGVEWVLKESKQVSQPRSPREIAEYEAGR
jgi:hypothetical protein